MAGETELQEYSRGCVHRVSRIGRERPFEINDGLYHGAYSINHPKRYAADLRNMLREKTEIMGSHVRETRDSNA